MTQIMEPSTCSTPARRRALPAAPILIRVPALSSAMIGGVRPRQVRRRLRREVRVAGCWLLALIPPSVACITWGGTRSHSPLLAVNSPDRVASSTGSLESPQRRITLSLEPVLAVQPHEIAESSVFLSGQLLPADTSEEPTHGGY